MIRALVLNDRTPKVIQVAIVSVAATCGIIAVGLLSTSFILSAKASKNNATRVALEKKRIELDETIASASKLKRVTDGKLKVGRVQSAFEDAASANFCTLQSFDVAQEPQPYVSRFDAGDPHDGWAQYSIKLTLNGTLNGMFEMLAQIAVSSGFPVEIDGIDMQPMPESTTASGTSGVSANITLRVMNQETIQQ